MTEAKFMGLLTAAYRADLQDIQQRLARERKDCIDILRAYKIGLNPGAATAEEVAQMARCTHCAKMVAQMGALASHPSVWSLVR